MSGVAGVTDAQNAMAEVQSRMSSISARFGVRPPNVSFAAELAGSSGWQGMRRAAGAGESFSQLALDGVSGSDVIAVGQEYLGVPYVWGGTDPSGFDCSGFLQHVYGRLGLELPRVSRDQARAGQPVASLAEARPGDLVAFNSPVDHIGIYAGGRQMLVAPKSGDVVKFQKITETPSAIRRVLRDPGAAPAAAPAAAELMATLLAERAGALSGLELGTPFAEVSA